MVLEDKSMDFSAQEEKINEFMQTFDANGDGKVQLSEWLEFYGGIFDAVVSQGMS